MRAEVKARGFGHVPDSLLDRWINLTYQDINDRYPWPFLETTTSGAAPLTISDFGHALSVVNTTVEESLDWEDLRTLRERDPSLSETGTPEVWYLDGSQLKVWPASTTDTISVRYVKVPVDLSADGDEPLLPERFHYLLVEGACQRAYRRANEQEPAADCAQEVEVGVNKMVNALLVPNYDTGANLGAGNASTDW